MSRLQCDRCGLVYERAVIMREIELVTGCHCRRCGGTLHAQESPGVAASPRADETAAASPLARPLPPERR